MQENDLITYKISHVFDNSKKTLALLKTYQVVLKPHETHKTIITYRNATYRNSQNKESTLLYSPILM